MMDLTRKRDDLIAHLEAALALADEVGDSVTGYLIETALDQARADDVAFGAALRPQGGSRERGALSENESGGISAAKAWRERGYLTARGEASPAALW
jgi:hypothetical protein